MKLSTNFELGKYFTFELSKQMPIHNWFYYKEGFAPQIVDYAIKQENVAHGVLFDPFCGCGTSILTAKSQGLKAIGIDISPIAVLASRVKCENYGATEIEQLRSFVSNAKLKEANYDWQFE